MSGQKRRASPSGAPPARHCAVSSRASHCPTLSGPGSHVRALPATGQAPASAAATTTLPAAPSARSAPGLAASPGSFAAVLVCSVSPSGLAGFPVAPAAAAATSHAASIAAALPRLVSSEGPPTLQEQQQLQFLWLRGGEAAHVHIA
jgi:hypothetical protein